jgi:electron transfer flavoprotein alpha subunit
VKACLIVAAWRETAQEAARMLLSATEGLNVPAHVILLGQHPSLPDQDAASLPCAGITHLSGAFDDSLSSAALADLLQPVLSSLSFDLLFFSGDNLGTELCVRLGHRLNAATLCDVRSLHLEEGTLWLTRGVYNQNLYADFSIRQTPVALTIAQGAFAPSERQAVTPPAIEKIACDIAPAPSVTITRDDISARLDNARRLVVGGRGIGGRDGLALLSSLAAAMDAQLGVTRPAYVDGWATHDLLVGISGTITRPEVVLVFAASGAAPFITGIKDAGLVIAINRDAAAPIFKSCDIGLVADFKAVAETLLQLMEGASS